MPSDERKRKQARRNLLILLAVSFLLHLLFLPLAPWLLISDEEPEVDTDESVSYVLPDMPDDAVIVDLEDNLESDKPPEDSPYFSERNRIVEKQSKAQDTGPNPQPAQPQPKSKPSPSQAEANKEMEFTEEPEGRKQFRLNTELPPDWLNSLAPRAPSNYLPNIEIGNQTLLSTREYAYAHFYIRMKRAMEYVWNPSPVLNQKERYYQPEYRTVLKIILNRDGAVERVEMVRSSSVTDLDQEAIRAVNLAGPFANPPDGLIGDDGKIRINEWHFIVNQKQTLF